MLIWRHDYFAHQHHIYLFWVPPTSHLLVLQVERVDVILADKDIAIVTGYEMRCIEFLRFFFEFRILELEFQFDDFSKAEFKKNIRPESPEMETELEFCFQWGSQISEW